MGTGSSSSSSSISKPNIINTKLHTEQSSDHFIKLQTRNSMRKKKTRLPVKILHKKIPLNMPAYMNKPIRF